MVTPLHIPFILNPYLTNNFIKYRSTVWHVVQSLSFKYKFRYLVRRFITVAVQSQGSLFMIHHSLWLSFLKSSPKCRGEQP